MGPAQLSTTRASASPVPKLHDVPHIRITELRPNGGDGFAVAGEPEPCASKKRTGTPPDPDANGAPTLDATNQDANAAEREKQMEGMIAPRQFCWADRLVEADSRLINSLMGLQLRSKSTMGVTRRVRLDVPVSTLVDAFRNGRESASMCDALAQIAMRLVHTQDREQFQCADGATTIVDHLARIWEEQATLKHAWQTSNVFGAAWTEHEVHDSLTLTLVAICHASVDASIAREMNELHALSLLFKLFTTLPSHLTSCQVHALECMRNLCFVELDLSMLPRDFVTLMWDEVLLRSKDNDEVIRQEIAADILGNLAFHDPTHVGATQQHLSGALALFFGSDKCHRNLQIALADLLCNLVCDPSYCLLLIYELDDRKPRTAYQRHSGAVFFADLAEKTVDSALRQSMEALAHNISWSDPAGKRNVQKLALSSYLSVFAAEPAINN